MFFCFVFGLEPWLLPPAVEMIEALKSRGHEVKVIYAEYRGEKPDAKDYNINNTLNIIPKQTGYKRLLTYTYLSKAVKDFQATNKIDILIACDILSLQAISGISGVKKGYWGFEIFSKPAKVKASFDYYRALRFPAWIMGLNFFLAPSESRVEKIKKRVGKQIPCEVIYNCRRYAMLKVNTSPSNETNIIYTGRISAAQYIEEIIGAMELVDKSLKLYLAGPASDDYSKKLKTMIDTNTLLKDRVFLTGRLSREDVYALTETASLGFVFYNEQMGDEAKDPAPNKLSDYIAAGIWTIGGPQAYIKYWLEERGAGVCIEEVHREDIALAINKIMSDAQFKDKTVLHDLYRNELNMGAQADKLLSLIKAL